MYRGTGKDTIVEKMRSPTPQVHGLLCTQGYTINLAPMGTQSMVHLWSLPDLFRRNRRSIVSREKNYTYILDLELFVELKRVMRVYL